MSMNPTASRRLRAASCALATAWTVTPVGAQAPAGLVTGYAAKMLCSTVFVAHRPAAEALREELKLAAPIPFRIDSGSRSVVAWVPGSEARRAVWREGLGCSLRSDSMLEPSRPVARMSMPAARSIALWPAGERIDTTRLPEGVSAPKLRAALDAAFAEPSPANPKQTRGIVVAWNGRIIAERYAKGYSAGSPQLGWSMTKSVTNALVGILVREGKLAVDRPAPVPEWQAAGDPRGTIKLDDLMRMSSGLAFDESYSLGTSDVARELFLVDNAGGYAASLRLSDPIGARWSYSSGTTNIISRIVRQAIGDDEAYWAFPHQALFEPLGMHTAVLERDPSGTFVGSSFMYASARDWARFGQLYLNDGIWNGVRILPPGWVKYSTSPARADSTGGYGAQVWINAGQAGGKRPHPRLPADAFFFMGYDQQNVVVIPSRGLVAVRLGYTPGREWDLDGFVDQVLQALPSPRYETILRGGTVIDGSGARAFPADIGISNGRIARIGNLAGVLAATDIDVRGLMVTPGFINIHSHASPAALPTAENMLTQGVTTELLNADGAGPTDLSVQLGPIGRAGLGVNVAASIGFNSIWQSVMGPSNRRPTPLEVEKMQKLILAGLEYGAFGVSSGLDYKPAYFATTDEVVEILKPAARWRTFFPNHDRSTPESGYSSRAGVEETRLIGERSGLVPQFTHMKIQGHEQGTAAQVIDMMNRSSAAGRWVAADVYPYLAGQTALSALIIPGWAQDGGTEAMRARFKDPAMRVRIVKESDDAIKARFNGPESIMVLGTRRLSDIMREVGASSPGDAVVKVLETESPWAILGFGIEADLVKIMQYHSSAIACDCGAAAGSRGHPRYYGTYPRVLGRYVRETHALTWEDAIRKMTGLPAAMIGLADRGLLAPGMAADITVFDSATVIDHATFEKPDAWSEGILHVLVNGRLALRDGKATGEQGGTVLRRTGNLPSRPMDLGGATEARASGTITLSGARTQVTVALRQAKGSQRATGTLSLAATAATPSVRSISLGMLQTASGWASITGRARVGPAGTERSFTLIVERSDPFVDGAPSTIRLILDGLDPIEGSLARRATILSAKGTR